MTHSLPSEDIEAKPLFEQAEEALKWAVEVLRQRRLPRTYSFFKELAVEAEFVAQRWEGGKNLSLPKDTHERAHLAMRVMDALDDVVAKDGEAGQLLRLWAWGDWADEGRLAAALAIQEKCRREGVRVRICYRYTYEQLGEILKLDKKVVWRRVREAFHLLEEGLVRRGLMVRFEVPLSDSNHFKKMVYSADFKIINE
jgi:hypothetical protein